MTIEVHRHEPGDDIADFMRAGFEVFRGDPSWVLPLDIVMKTS